MKKLRELAGTDGQLAMQIVCQSVERGWTGLFPLRDTTPATGIHQSRPEPAQRHKTVQEALARTESREENERAWRAQQAMYGNNK